VDEVKGFLKEFYQGYDQNGLGNEHAGYYQTNDACL